jgi:superfamily II DNA or RNA helicase
VLREDQQEAVAAILKYDDGVLSATTAFGKTVIAAKMIAERQANTLVLVHRRQLLDQWRERLSMFLDIEPARIGEISGGKNRLCGEIDIALIQSLYRKGEVLDCAANYGHVIVDECHHLSAFSFEQVLRQVKARYVLGLTATPVRKDGHHPIIFMQCGPIRHRVDALKQAAMRPFSHWVIPRPTFFQLPPDSEGLPIQQLYQLLAKDSRRNEIIVLDTVAALAEGRFPLILTERRQHAEDLALLLKDRVPNLVMLTGGKSSEERRDAAARLAAISDNETRLIIATGRYLGEGFDNARLDTLLLALPVSWRGTLQQYTGRLHRLHAHKKEVRVLDYVDDAVPMLSRMYARRIKGYEAVGYQIRRDDELII